MMWNHIALLYENSSDKELDKGRTSILPETKYEIIVKIFPLLFRIFKEEIRESLVINQLEAEEFRRNFHSYYHFNLKYI